MIVCSHFGVQLLDRIESFLQSSMVGKSCVWSQYLIFYFSYEQISVNVELDISELVRFAGFLEFLGDRLILWFVGCDFWSESAIWGPEKVRRVIESLNDRVISKGDLLENCHCPISRILFEIVCIYLFLSWPRPEAVNPLNRIAIIPINRIIIT